MKVADLRSFQNFVNLLENKHLKVKLLIILMPDKHFIYFYN
jgi:hypothetical protein